LAGAKSDSVKAVIGWPSTEGDHLYVPEHFRESRKVVPTWNYAAVHVTGSIRFIEDSAWLLELVESLTDEHEHGRPDRWRVADAPQDYRDNRLRAIIGLEITVTGMTGKFKSSQNRPVADRAGVIRGLRADGVTDEALSELVRDPGE
jgi:transcriptional regulator